MEVELVTTGRWMWAEYDSVIVQSEANDYRLHAKATGYRGNAGDAFNYNDAKTWRANGMSFSTPDVDNDRLPKGSCALFARSGWWFNWCSSSNLNGATASWFSSSVSASRMMLQCGAATD